jgi:hypothetical protein
VVLELWVELSVLDTARTDYGVTARALRQDPFG